MSANLDAAAIVVGINDYLEPIPKLSGSTTDAEDVASWLVSIGVPASRITLHLGGPSKVPPPGVTLTNKADRDSIWNSMAALEGQTGEYLFVFLSGHGYYLSNAGPIFLAADWQDASTDKNFSLRLYAEYLQSLNFKRTFFFVDACQNKDVDDIYASTIEPGRPGKKYSAKPKNGVLLCCATSQGQYAPVVDGRGLFTRRFLEVARQFPKVVPEAPDANIYDWKLGHIQLDVVRLLEYAVGPWVTQQAAARRHDQTPSQHPFGDAAVKRSFILQEHKFPDSDLTKLAITVDPPTGLDEITLELRSIAPTYRLPKDSPVPFEAKVPLQRRLHAFCMAQHGWNATPSSNRADPIQTPINWHFDLSGPPPSPPRGPPIAAPGPISAPDPKDLFNLTVIGEDGSPSGDLVPRDYEAAGVNIAASSFKMRGRSFKIDAHETGPGLTVTKSADKTRKAAVRLRDQLSAALKKRGIERQITITEPGQHPDRALPNVRFQAPEGPPAEGFLGHEETVIVERLGAREPEVARHTLERVRRFPWTRLAPGTYRVRVDLPWGRAETVFEAPPNTGAGSVEGPAVIRLPRPIGEEPLRNSYFRKSKEWRERIAGDRGQLLSVKGEGPEFLVSRIPVPEGVHVLAEVADDGSIRAEPYSDLPWKEWDLVIAKGRLHSVDLWRAFDRLKSESAGRPDINILTLGLAYAAQAQQKPGVVSALIRRLQRPYLHSADAILLSNGVLPVDAPSIASGIRPLFRWGAEMLRSKTESDEARTASSSIWAIYETAPMFEPEPQPEQYMALEQGMAAEADYPASSAAGGEVRSNWT